MKKALINLSVLACATLALPAVAEFKGTSSAGGYVGPSSVKSANTAEAILKNPIDDQRVTLRGNITRHIGGDKYMFSDGTGEIRVDIDDHQFPPQTIDETTTVEITGEVDSDFLELTEIDVKSIRIVQ